MHLRFCELKAFKALCQWSINQPKKYQISKNRLETCFSLDRMITDLFNEVPKVAVDARTDYVEEVMNGYFKSITEFGTLATGTLLIVRTKTIKKQKNDFS